MDDDSNKGVLATNGFTKEEVELIKEWFLEKYELEVTIEIQNGKENPQYVIYIPSKTKPKFYNIIHEYIIPSMSYKFKGWTP